MLGLDISKWAIQAAAKQDKRPGWVVATNAQLPVQAGTLDRVLCMFGFPVYTEFARVLIDCGVQWLQAGNDFEYMLAGCRRTFDAIRGDRSSSPH